MTCAGCGSPGVARGSRYCSHRCWSSTRSAKYLDLLDLVELGESPDRAMERVGASPVAASKWFYRNGHTTLARYFGAKRWRR